MERQDEFIFSQFKHWSWCFNLLGREADRGQQRVSFPGPTERGGARLGFHYIVLGRGPFPITFVLGPAKVVSVPAPTVGVLFLFCRMDKETANMRRG